MKRAVKRFTIPEYLSDQRLDFALTSSDQTLSGPFIQKIIDFGGVHVNGRRTCNGSHNVNCGDKVELFIDGFPYQPFILQDGLIVYRDEFILVINKPAGIDCQPTHSRYNGTIYSALLKYLANPYKRHLKPSIGMVQRLDRDTSGLMVFSIHAKAHRNLTEQFSLHTIKKRYIAFVSGRMCPEIGEFKSLLAKNRATNRMKSVERGGKEAITCFTTVQAGDSASIVEIDLITGRSHQIRAHFSEAGHPLLGDTRYGGPANYKVLPLKRQMLHANSLSFIHPVHGDRLAFNLSLPDDMSPVEQLIFTESL